MEALRIHTVIQEDGEITVTNIPCKKGQHVEMIVLFEGTEKPIRKALTARELLESGLIGLWEDREETMNSSAFARELREKAQHRLRKT